MRFDRLNDTAFNLLVQSYAPELDGAYTAVAYVRERGKNLPRAALQLCREPNFCIALSLLARPVEVLAIQAASSQIYGVLEQLFVLDMPWTREFAEALAGARCQLTSTDMDAWARTPVRRLDLSLVRYDTDKQLRRLFALMALVPADTDFIFSLPEILIRRADGDYMVHAALPVLKRIAPQLRRLTSSVGLAMFNAQAAAALLADYGITVL